MKAFQYLFFIASCFGILYTIGQISSANNPVESALETDRLISNSRLYAKEHAYRRSLAHLDMAIRSIEDIEQKLDDSSKAVIDIALKDLKKVSNEIIMKKPVDEDMNNAFAKALNALTFAEIKITEHFVESDQHHEARVALKYGMIHIQNALKFIDNEHRGYELQIYRQIDSIIKRKDLDKKIIISELERMSQELNDLVTE
jgi:hypothetical protein